MFRRFHHISPNHDYSTLIEDIEKKDIGAFCCYSLVIRNYNTYNIAGKNVPAFCIMFLNAF